MKRNIFKSFGLMLAAMAAIAPSHTAVKAQHGQTQSQKSKEMISSFMGKGNQIVRQSAGGLDVIGYGGGIPPQVYGERFVRRGTHKRTNRK